MSAAASTERTIIPRHKTAILRPGLSIPVQCLLRDGLIGGDLNFFDYGCGRGGDLELLTAIGVQCSGWDPVYRPDVPVSRAEAVNLGYVLNVIEDIGERATALRQAWELCDTVLVVAALGPSNGGGSLACESFADGVITSRGTFQRHFTHQELRAYLEEHVPTDAVAAAPNVFYLFRSEEARQKLLASRFHRTLAVPHKRVSDVLFEQNRDVLEPFMASLTSLGRLPGPEELIEQATITDRFGSLRRAFQVVRIATGQGPWKEIAARRREDLLVYLALAMFGRRRPLSQLPLATQRDIKAFVGTYARAQAEARELLFSVGDPANIDACCQRASAGVLVDNALVLRRDALDHVAPALRVYEACARAIVGEVEGANVVKLHRRSGKVTYLACDDMDTSDDPVVRLRIKVTLPRLAIDVFDYSDWPQPPRTGLPPGCLRAP